MTAGAPIDPGAVATAEDAYAAYSGFVDGRYAGTSKDVKLLVNGDTYGYFGGIILTGSDTTATRGMMQEGGGLMTSANLPDVDAMISLAIRARGMMGSGAVCPVWEGVRVLRDEISPDMAAKGQIALTVYMLYSFAVIRSEQFGLVKFKTAA